MAQTTSELEESLLIRLLTTSPDRRLTDSERKAFDAAHEDYIDALQALSQYLRKSPLEILHRLIRADARLCRLKNCICDKHSLQASLLKSAIQLTNFEIRLIFTRLRYPSIADPVSAEVPKSPLFLSEQFTPTDIMELATALQLSGAIRASTAHGSIWRHLSMCFPELSTSVSTIRNSVAMPSSTVSCA